jgi:Predicted membrane protein involved in D-alanine export
MSIQSLGFIIFLIAVIAVYFAVPKKAQWVVLLGASYFFYASGGLQYIAYIIISTVSVYLCARFIEKEDKILKNLLEQNKLIYGTEEKRQAREASKKKKQRLLVLIIVLNLGILAFFKYFNFIADNFNALLDPLGIQKIPNLDLIMPLGISFYTLIAIGYLIDIYRGKYTAEKNLAKFALFIVFFPQIVQGPFVRFKDMAPQLFAQHKINYKNIKYGIQLMLWGYIKKQILADRIGLYVTQIFNNYQNYTGTQAVIATVFYTIQIYADFSGYMDIMTGFCQILGINLTQNFMRPYFSKSIGEFWRRWHITLSSWFREYVFYPLATSKTAVKLGKAGREKFGAYFGSLLPSVLALFPVWFLTGLWHGANWTFIIWGICNGIIIIVSMELGPFYDRAKEKLHINVQSFWWRLFQVARTFFLICLMRLFSRASDLSTSIGMYKKVFTDMNFGDYFKLNTYLQGITVRDLLIVAVFIGIFLAVSLLQRRHIVRDLIAQRPLILRWFLYICAFYSLILLSVSTGGGFLYAVF